jgi:trigger factor
MEIVEIKNDALKHELIVAIPAHDFAQRYDKRLQEVASKTKKPGFRPGKVPLVLIQREYGDAIDKEVTEELISESVTKVLTEKNIKPALPGKIQNLDKATDKSISYSLLVEALPQFDVMDLKSLSLKKPIADLDPSLIDKKLKDYADACVHFHDLKQARPSQKDDLVKVEFTVDIDGNAYQNAKVFNHQVIVGDDQPQSSLVEQMQKHLLNISVGDSKKVDITLGEDIPEEELKGKAATIAFKVVSIQERETHEVDDSLAKHYGLESLSALKDVAESEVKNQIKQATRIVLKRQILDQLDKTHQFLLPECLIEREHQVVMQEAAQENEIPAEDNKEERQKFDETVKSLTERRVRLGLILAEIGQKNNIQVSEEELRMALFMRARRYPGKEREVVQFYLQNPEAMATVKAPILEEKIIDYISSIAQVAENNVSTDDLFKAEQDALEGELEA